MPRRALSWILFAFVPALVLLMAGTSSARAGDKEVREFAVTIDGRPAGSNVMKISSDKEGRQILSNQANISISYLVTSYKYVYFGIETWKDGRLQGFTSTCNDDGKKFNVAIVPDKKGMRLTSNKKERSIPSDVWLTTYWRLPDPKLVKDGMVSLIDADTGKELSAKINKVKEGKVVLAGKECSHYRLTGDVKADLWYDNQDKLVRQEFDDSGHRVVLMLKD
jgi:hypothetical protein